MQTFLIVVSHKLALRQLNCARERKKSRALFLTKPSEKISLQRFDNFVDFAHRYSRSGSWTLIFTSREGFG